LSGRYERDRWFGGRESGCRELGFIIKRDSGGGMEVLYVWGLLEYGGWVQS
jgi:hypothetical protein